MNTDNRQRFEDRLLAELDQIVAEQPAPARTPKRQGLGWRPRVALGASALTLGAAAVVVPTVVDHGTEPAFAVTKEHRDGKDVLLITINELENPEALERDLAEKGIEADITYLENGKSCQADRFELARSAAIDPNLPDGPLSISVDADDKGQLLVLELSRFKGEEEELDILKFSGGYARGEVEPCKPVSN